MAYCAPLGIPYTAFLGWDPLDQDAALAWQTARDDRCGGCGLPRSEMVGTDGKELREQPYAPVDVHCAGCEAKARHEKDRDPDALGVATGFLPTVLAEAEFEAAEAERRLFNEAASRDEDDFGGTVA